LGLSTNSSNSNMSFEHTGFLEHTLTNELSAEYQRFDLLSGGYIELWDTGVLHCVPAGDEAGHRVVISSGIHGNETAPMEIVDQLVADIKTGRLDLRNHLLFIVGNPPAANLQKRFVVDNMNRLFSGDHQQYADSPETMRAASIEKSVEKFFSIDDLPRLHYDLHTAIRGSEFEKFAVYPYRHDGRWSRPQLGFLEGCGIQAVLLSNKPSTTFSYFTAETFKADSFTVELGSVRPFGQNDMSRFSRVSNGLARLIENTERFSAAPKSILCFAVLEEVIKQSDAFELHIPDDAKNFTQYPRGTVLASDAGYEYKTQQDGERFVFPIKNVPIGNRAMLVVAPTEI
jgi:succinylglutamate desuccinylase